MEKETAECRWCKKPLIGKPYYMGTGAYFKNTMESVPVNYYGGYACSYQCDKNISTEMEGSMPGAGKCHGLSSGAQISLSLNWK